MRLRLIPPLLIGFLIGASYITCFTQAGGAWVTTQLIPYFYPALTVEHFEGRLFDHFALHDVRIQHHARLAHCAHVAVHWHPLQILKQYPQTHTINLESVNFEGYKLTLLPTEASPATVESPIPPVDIRPQRLPVTIDQLTLKTGVVAHEDQQFPIETITIQGFNLRHPTTIPVAEITSPLGYIKLNQTATDYQVAWDLAVPDIQSFLPALQGPVKTQGQLHGSPLDDSVAMTASLRSQSLTYREHTLTDIAWHIQPEGQNHRINIQRPAPAQPVSGTVAFKMLPDQQGSVTLNFDELTGEILLAAAAPLKTLTAKLNYRTGTIINSQVHVSSTAPFQISGTLDSTSNDFSSLSTHFKPLILTNGQWNSYLDIEGTLFSPRITGTLKAKDLSISMPDNQATGTLRRLTIERIGTPEILITGDGKIGEGPFKLTGTGTLINEQPTLHITLNGEHMQLIQSPEYTITASPHLTVTGTPETLLIKGRIIVPEATIKPHTDKPRTILSKDVKLITQKPQTPSQQLNEKLACQVQVILGQGVTFDGFDVKTRVVGDLAITKAPHGPFKGKGSLYAEDGIYRAHNRQLTVTYGRLMFTDTPLTQPLLDIRAEKQIKAYQKDGQSYQNMTIGLNLNGPLHALKLTPFSQPALPEKDILSYLALGYASNEHPMLPGHILLDSATQITNLINRGQWGDYDVASKLKVDIGVETRPQSVSQTQMNEMVLTLGKQLTDRLYMNYSVGILDAASQLGLKFLLGKNAFFEAHTGERGSGADLFIMLEGR